ncbi:hypothetical protein [Staphylococcus equorum]|uniref:hypothetical protein n=1 Tax=Staphylococcus equorum TaxID=246432 RepID=UPI002554317D|nr:hypothetical protein [Staphylococcus equorum]MDK9858717.1 hypothetical protein [Staphylococcus equorum]
MFIAQANFTANIEDRAILDNKATHAKDDFSGYDGFIEVEVWKNEKNLKFYILLYLNGNKKRISKHG